MKFMRLGTRPDTFYTGEATRTMISDLPSDLTININNIKYLLHKFPLVQKCGLLQQLCSQMGDAVSVDLHDIPGGADAFELCAKFCYGIKIDLSAHNFVPAISAATYLRMTESVVNANFVSKLEFFFNSCILQGWKDSVVTLQTTENFSEWSETLGIIRACIDSVVDKILTPPQKVRWSYTYTRPGYAQKKHHKSAPKDWWTEDIADLNVDLFRCVINIVKSTNMFPPQLIGESLHVYVCRWLPDVSHQPETSTSTTSQEEESLNRKKQLEIIVNLIPEDKGSVSVGFLLRLLSISNRFGASNVISAHLIKKCSLKLEEATPKDLMLPDIEMVEAVLESFITQWRKKYSREEHSRNLIIKIGKLIDSYLQIVCTDANMSVQKVVSLANALPEFARPEHDNLYKAINVYLNEHPQMSKEEKKCLCSILECHKLSKEACAHAVKNERLPLRTVVQVLFFEHEKHGGKSTTSQESQKPQGVKIEGSKRTSGPSLKFEPESKQDKVGEIMEQQDHIKIRIQRSKSEHGGHKGK